MIREEPDGCGQLAPPRGYALRVRGEYGMGVEAVSKEMAVSD